MRARDRLPRSPWRVALLTLFAIVVVGLVGSLVILSVNGNLSDHPNERGRAIGRGLAPIALIGAAIAYGVQRRRLR